MRQAVKIPTFWKRSRLKILRWMASAVSTESAVSARMDRRDVCYAITSPMRVRKEAFGLLFYNTEDSRLTFVKSGDLLQINVLPHGAKTITAPLEPENRSRVRKLLDHLLKKRLICES
jgi:putative mycofactocin binding protein MftB